MLDWLRKRLGPIDKDVMSQRAYPGQKDEANMFGYGTAQNVEDYLIWYSLNPWVGIAVDHMASSAAMASLNVYRRKGDMQKLGQHGLVDLVGQYGRPNDAQDSVEFLEQHFSNWMLTGNSYWYWVAPLGGRPTEVHALNPGRVVIVPGTDRTVSHYLYRTMGGRDMRLGPDQVTHFKRYNPFSRYLGMSLFEACRLELRGDRSMSIWNDQFFGDDVGIPAGIMFVPADTPDKDLPRITDEFNAQYGARRRTAVVRGTPGAQMYHPAGAVHKDLDFGEGRLLVRQIVYERIGLPLGMLSESSTEAHARVAERQKGANVDAWLSRTGNKLTADALKLWPGWGSYAVRFEDKRRDVADWEQNQRRVETMLKTHTINEIRQIVFNDKPVAWGERDDDEVRLDRQDREVGGGSQGASQGIETSGSTNRQPLDSARERLQE